MLDHAAASNERNHVHDRVCAILQGVLRGAQVRGITDEALHLISGVPARTIKSYRVEGKDPSLSNALSLLSALGPDALNAVLSAVGYAGAKPLGDSDELDARKIVADVLPHISTIAQAAADGRIDHTEQSECEAAADHIIAAVLPLSKARHA